MYDCKRQTGKWGHKTNVNERQFDLQQSKWYMVRRRERPQVLDEPLSYIALLGRSSEAW